MNSKSNEFMFQRGNNERLKNFKIKTEEYAQEYEACCKRTIELEEDLEHKIRKTTNFEIKLDKLLLNYNK